MQCEFCEFLGSPLSDRLSVCNLFDDTFRVFVKVCDINAFIRANSLCADEVAHCLFLTVDLSEGPIYVLLPVDFITVNLGEQETEQVLK